jgi:hypothetical protein
MAVQSSFMTVWVANVHVHDQRMISAVKLATVLECTTEEQHSVLRFLWAKGLVAKDIYKEIFPIYGGKCLWYKAVHKWVEKFPQGCSKVACNVRPDHSVAIAIEATVQWVDKLI